MQKSKWQIHDLDATLMPFLMILEQKTSLVKQGFLFLLKMYLHIVLVYCCQHRWYCCQHREPPKQSVGIIGGGESICNFIKLSKGPMTSKEL